MEITPEISSKIKQLDEKYQAMGQDMNSYLDGLVVYGLFEVLGLCPYRYLTLTPEPSYKFP